MDRRLGGPKAILDNKEKRKISPLPGIEYQFPCRSVHSTVVVINTTKGNTKALC
jgi:hypothetical protein